LNDVRLETIGHDTFALRGGSTLSVWRVPNTREGALEPLPITGPNEGGVRIVARVAAGVLVASRAWPAEKLWIFDGSLTVRQIGLLPRVSRDEVEAGGERVYLKLEEAGLWSSDGTEEGTLQVDSRPVEMRRVLPGGRLIYLSWDPGSGKEHWTSDGSLAGTTLLDLVPGPGSVHRDIGLASSEAAYLFAPGNDSRELLQITAD
jgi:ELWxxDGT repeat protein